MIRQMIEPEQIISGIKKALLKCEAINPSNVASLESLFNNQVLNDIKRYGLQDNICDCEQHYYKTDGGDYKCIICDTLIDESKL